ncbi:MAG TPA: orotidine-5'-phosphate decarboxylase [Longimicrobiales bacterium]|nr:orotidine-5'-phosphate decarboxylase [Longimicrobiales bacterium]
MADIIVALDLDAVDDALRLVDRLGERVDFYKVAAPLFTRAGPGLVRTLRDLGRQVFLDLKFHDIPNTVAGAVAAARDLDVQLLTVHASGGEAMLRAAREAAGKAGPKLLGVTVLTSFTAQGIGAVWGRAIDALPREVDRLADMAADAQFDGVIASPLEVAALKRRHGPAFLVVTPGIRPPGYAPADQARVATPAAAARAGADYLVIGRPVLEAADPVAVVESVRADLAGVSAEA